MKIEDKINTLIEYLKVKLDERDFHAISDVANDLRVLEAEQKFRGIKSVHIIEEKFCGVCKHPLKFGQLRCIDQACKCACESYDPII